MFPDASLEEASNFCRNPDKEVRVWCYTVNPDVRWEYCDVEMCESEYRKAGMLLALMFE